ncbi:DNA repair protein [Rhodobacteraceae bacterium CCMM004]|nr:DNA repair protein [Rhodobacteraceae bacterium CCMM004]
MGQKTSASVAVQAHLHWVSLALIVGAALVATAATMAAAAGLLPWLTLPLTFGEVTYQGAGVLVQIGVTILLLLIAATQVGPGRVLRLERSHRDFGICMSDVADAYAAVHAADRAGAFTMSEQFDDVKQRIDYLRRHPDLGHLEGDVLQAAAQMSHMSRDLAETYSDENMERAKTFLRERQEEVERVREQIGRVLSDAHELRRWLEAVEVEEEINASQLRRMEDQMADVLTYLGFRRESPRGRVIQMPQATAAE